MQVGVTLLISLHIPILASLSARFQNRDLRIRPLGGNFTENLIFKAKITNSSIQRSTIRKIDPIFFEVEKKLAAERLAYPYQSF